MCYLYEINFFQPLLLVYISLHHRWHPISDHWYAKAIKVICSSLGIAMKHFVHIGCLLGNKEYEMMEDDDDKFLVIGIPNRMRRLTLINF
jgi:hypothetical protein